MKRRNATRSALFTSIISLLLCVSMLVGTTFAWFTDEVMSGRNVIAAGNLDVELYANGQKVTGETVLFDDVDPDLWEPGAVAYENLQVKNEGSLALKYNLDLTVLNETVVNGYKLSDVIMVGTTTKAIAQDSDRATVIGSITNWVPLSGFSFNMNGEELAANTADDEFSVVLYWKPNANDVDNRYNLNNGQAGELKLEIGVNLFATQVEAEVDSFGDDYDENADIESYGYIWDGEIPAEKPDSLVVDTEKKLISVNDAEAFAYLNTLLNDTDFATTYGSKWQYSIELNADINLDSHAWTPIIMSNFVSFDGKGHTIGNLYVAPGKDNAGLFAQVLCNDIGVTYVKNLKLNGAVVSGNQSVGALIGNAKTADVQNCSVNNATVIGNKYVGGIYGWGGGAVNGCSVTNSTISIPTTGAKEAGGLIGYVSNDGFASTTNKVIAGNTVKNVTISAPTVASGLVSQPNSSNSGGAVIEITNNTMENVKITTADATAALYVSNNVNDKTIVKDNTATNCSVSAAASTAAELKDALKNGTDFIDANGANLGDLNYGLNTSTVPEGKTVTISNATFEGKSYGNAVDGTVVFENCTFTNTGAYSIHFDAGKGDVIFKNCTLYGWNSFGASLNSVSFYDCTLYGNGTYGLIRSYVDLHVKNCYIDTTNANHNDVYPEGVEVVNGAALTESNNTYVVSTADELVAALTAGKDVVLTDDVEMESATTAPYGNKYAVKLDGGVLDGNGKELHMECYGDDYGIMTTGGTIKNITIQEGCRAVMIMYPQYDIILDNVNIGGDGVLYPINTGEGGAEGVDLIVTNSTLAGWTSYGLIESASFTNVKFEQGTYYGDSVYGRVLKPYVNTTLTDCSFVEHMNLDLTALTNGHKITIKNCTVNGQVVNAGVFTIPTTDAQYNTELFTIDLPSWATSISDCVVFQ